MGPYLTVLGEVRLYHHLDRVRLRRVHHQPGASFQRQLQRERPRQRGNTLYTPICETASSVPSWIEGDPFITNRRAKYSGQPRAISSTWRLTMARTCCFAVLCPFAVMPWLLSRLTASRFSCGDIRMHGVTPNTSAVIWLNSRSSAAGAVTVSLGRNTSLRTRSVQVTRLYVRQAAAGAFSDGFICTGRTGAGGSAIAPSSSFSLYTEPSSLAASARPHESMKLSLAPNVSRSWRCTNDGISDWFCWCAFWAAIMLPWIGGGGAGGVDVGGLIGGGGAGPGGAGGKT
uniref:Uncharacterized protein n=1 Tax=Anopheles merus TaxID=30066 RepID=A0A182UTL5_ANOME